ncbi:SDR family NAD(P)-dependent oxidoreductase [Cupriavidus basilensis]|uniref:SDR family NAD(P)-dependent oxidoreductase n=1 Tax=Cupriavidus basilensis TaxID=68895 RepID=A0ABT6B0S2_9BURK|nr:SDR family NAD(P)-dependent oxidoreductase [Cupriavidus basilensis]MDF3838077.1 SDR family NAD(P)-dependent oxidoreductase [Cupriavidus basilensis]
MSEGTPRNIVITGASAGIGQALATAYAAPGVTLGLVGRNAGRLEACVRQCRQAGAEVISAELDVRDPIAMADWLHAFDDNHPIDLLIANAGVASTLSSARDWEDLARTREVFDTNFYGAMHTVLPIIGRMRARRHGQVALISSLAAIRGMAISPAYCASKSAIKAYGESVRPLLARDGVDLSLVFPGFVKTAMSDVFPGDKPFLWSADKAARHIRAKLAANKAEIAFPGLLAFGMGLLPLLPARLADSILDRLSYLPREEH